MSFVPEDLQQLLPASAPGQTLWVGLSGGLDSCVLLDSLAQLRLSVSLRALHINHQLSPNADTWQAHCAAFCAKRQIPLIVERVKVEVSGRGLEDAARAARYEVFERYLQAGDWLCTGHHADDQAETLMLRLLRGAGPKGLASMAGTRPLGQGRVLRPLLGVSRGDLEAYARTRGLAWVNDESNDNTDFDRNFLRQSVMPLLKSRWPTLEQRLGLTARLCGDADLLLGELAALDLARIDLRPERLGQSLDLQAMAGLSRARWQNLLRYWLVQLGMALPEQPHLQQIEQQLLAARADTESCVAWAAQSLRCYRQRLYALPALSDPANWQTLNWVIPTGESSHLSLPGNAQLRWEYAARVTGSGWLRTDLPSLQLRWRQGGERCQPESRAHSQTLKKLLQDVGLEPWWRDQLPLVYSGNQLVAVGDLWVCRGFAAQAGEPGYRLSWLPGQAAPSCAH